MKIHHFLHLVVPRLVRGIQKISTTFAFVSRFRAYARNDGDEVRFTQQRRPPIKYSFLLLFFSITAFADVSTTTENNYPDSWHVYLVPNFWLAGVNGFFKINDEKANFNHALDDFKNNASFGADTHFEISRAPWSLMLDSAYTQFNQNVHVAGLKAKAILRVFDLDGGAYYQVLPEMSPKGSTAKALFELFGGGRIMTFDSTIYFFHHAPTISDTSGFLVPILGARVKCDFNDKFRGWINGDFGGFHITHVTSTWSGMVGISYNFTKQYGINLAYRALGVHYYKKSTTVNTVIQGPMLGMSFTW